MCPHSRNLYYVKYPPGNGHIDTVIPFLIQKFQRISYFRHRLELEDGDFIDLDFSSKNPQNSRIVVFFHGLEGSSQSGYIVRNVKKLSKNGFDCVAVNFRGCSGTPNRLFTSYHSGSTADISHVLHYLSSLQYHQMYLIGFSLGGNVVLKYVAEIGQMTQPIAKAIAISAPIFLHDCAIQLSKPDCKRYLHRFLKSMKKKLLDKKHLIPHTFDLQKALASKNFQEFDAAYTAPVHGFQSVNDYYTTCSSAHYLDKICVPTLLINAKNDPFLAPTCFDKSIIHTSSFVESFFPDRGGHVGFLSYAGYILDELIIDFISADRN